MFSVDDKLEIISDKKTPNNKNKSSYNRSLKNIFIILALIVFFAFIIWRCFFYDDSMYSSIKHYKDREIVFTQSNNLNTNKQFRIPIINVESVDVDKLNQDITNFSNTYIANTKNALEYTFNISGDILSLVIRVIDNSAVEPLVHFRTYIVNLNTKKSLNNDDILALYYISTNTVEDKIKSKFNDFYNEEVNLNIFKDECDYKCFLYLRGITNYLDNAYYYIDKGHLYVFKEFKIYSIYDESDYFKESDFKIKIVD